MFEQATNFHRRNLMVKYSELFSLKIIKRNFGFQGFKKLILQVQVKNEKADCKIERSILQVILS